MSVETTSPTKVDGKPRQGRVKCIAWDLDNTVWDGVLLEGDDLRLRTDVVEVIAELDRLGVLHSVASKNDPDAAMAKLREFGIEEYFIYPQIGWNAKSAGIAQIAKSINIGVDAIAFVDDQEFERDEVAHALPQVICVDVVDLHTAVQEPEFRPRFVTAESATRRDMYRQQIARAEAEQSYVGPSEEFLASLAMVFTISGARQEDLQRAEELTIRTNQLNSTGRTYSYEELDVLRTSPDHLLLVATLDDKYGSYGTIGLCLLEKGTEAWYLRLLLMSCRVVSRGVGTVLLNHLIGLAAGAGVPLRADFVETGRNRMMQITYAFAGFQEVSRDGDTVVLERGAEDIQPHPATVTVVTDDAGVNGR
ncbi:HAD-IIIC family phosphatase [Actinokineospora sp.]|uniref:HAD-IIIC family phosphatase n=1 Tax=Actinokineospora sp. TaxID=1872133 RepID=UPI0040379087